MVEHADPSQLQATKEKLGQMLFLDLVHLDSISAHRKLGEEVSRQVHPILGRKLSKLDRDGLAGQVRLIRRCKAATRQKSVAPGIDLRVRRALTEYLACLASWGEGARLDRCWHPMLDGLDVDGEPITPEDLALWLLLERSGCQTGVYREQDGSVLLWHTEEDMEAQVGDRFERLRLVSYRAGEGEAACTLRAFVYPDLLPGSAFCWRQDDYVQAVDTLFIKAHAGDGGVPANTATWVTLRLGDSVPPAEVIGALGPLVNGYALMVAHKEARAVSASRIEFARDQMHLSPLDERAGGFLFQVNILSSMAAPIAAVQEKLRPASRKWFADRIARTEKAMQKVRMADDAQLCLLRLLSSRLGGDGAYANTHVKSYLLARISRNGTLVRLGEGPALKGDTLRSFSGSGQSYPRIAAV